MLNHIYSRQQFPALHGRRRELELLRHGGYKFSTLTSLRPLKLPNPFRTQLRGRLVSIIWAWNPGIHFGIP
jgi:hypothetical protein